MPHVAIRDRLQEERAAAGAGVRDCPTGCFSHRQDAHAVDGFRRHLHRLRAGTNRSRGDLLEGRVLAVAVVLAEEDDRKPQHGAEVEALVEVALVDRSVAELAHRHSTDPLQGESDARGGSDRPADDPERADEPVVRRVDVHRAGPTPVHAGGAAEHLVEQALRVDAERERMAVAAVGRTDAIAILEHARHADGDRLLARVEMRHAVDLAA